MNRRSFVRTVAGSAAAGLAGQSFAAGNTGVVVPKGKAEHCIMLWLGGGASQTDTFDPKRLGDPKKRVAGSAYKAIDTVVRGVQVCEHMPNIAKLMDRVTVCRTVGHPSKDEHAAATNWVHTGRPVSGTVVYPSVGSLVAHEKGAAEEGVPPYVLIGYPNVTRGPGFLGAKAGYLYLTDTKAGPAGLSRPTDISSERQARREALLGQLRITAKGKFAESDPLRSYDDAIGESLRLAGPQFMNVFQLESEKASLRESYGSEFGQRCLLARRLIQRGVRFIEISQNLNFVNGTGWDTHNAGQEKQHELIWELDKAVGTLMTDLENHRLLDKTLIVIATEFGRPPEFDGGGGRGHQSKVFSMVLAGGGLNHCGALGETDELAKKVVSRPMPIADFHATIHNAMGIDPSKFIYDGDRPVPVTDGGKAAPELFS